MMTETARLGSPSLGRGTLLWVLWETWIWTSETDLTGNRTTIDFSLAMHLYEQLHPDSDSDRNCRVVEKETEQDQRFWNEGKILHFLTQIVHHSLFADTLMAAPRVLKAMLCWIARLRGDGRWVRWMVRWWWSKGNPMTDNHQMVHHSKDSKGFHAISLYKRVFQVGEPSFAEWMIIIAPCILE